MSGFIAVHCGAGYHKVELQPQYKKVCKKACDAAANALKNGSSALIACERAVMVLEEHPITNAGYGSSLTVTSKVECDASIMDGETMNFGGCAAVEQVKYPISLATVICKNQSFESSIGLMRPMLLVGKGAKTYARKAGLAIVKNEELKSKGAIKKHKKFMNLLKKAESLECADEKRLDTVGAVCVDGTGHVASACSSGGIGLKLDGRVGQAAMYGCGVWADSTNKKTSPSVAVTTTGAGEYLIKTMLAKEIATKITSDSNPVVGFHSALKDGFLDSPLLKNVPNRKLAGALAIHVMPSGHVELIYGHSCRTMGFAYRDVSAEKSIAEISVLPKHLEGLSNIVSGKNFKINFS